MQDTRSHRDMHEALLRIAPELEEYADVIIIAVDRYMLNGVLFDEPDPYGLGYFDGMITALSKIADMSPIDLRIIVSKIQREVEK